ncbi:hypothetical protein ACIBBD_18380 [Streptomyces sp. NPDC051315]|uniref:hypothetical protein n=1 Tax=Streptomyces sp. NPDC051315 TaxID=3365650 RepID=UPI0037B7C4EF
MNRETAAGAPALIRDPGSRSRVRWPSAGINRPQHNRAVATRFDKLAVRFGTTVHIAAINERR